MFGVYRFGVPSFGSPGVFAGTATLSHHPTLAGAGTAAGTSASSGSGSAAVAHTLAAAGVFAVPVYAGASSLPVGHTLAGGGTFVLGVDRSGSGSLTPAHPTLAATGVLTVPAYAGVATLAATHAIAAAGTFRVVEVRFTDVRTVNFLHVGDVGMILQPTIDGADGSPLDLSAASLIQFVFEKPDGTMLTTDGGFLDGGSGVARYAFSQGDLDQSGTWRYQVFVQVGAASFHSDIGKIRVLPNLPLST